MTPFLDTSDSPTLLESSIRAHRPLRCTRSLPLCFFVALSRPMPSCPASCSAPCSDPGASLIPVPANTFTRQVRAARPALSQAPTQCSAAEPLRACNSPSHHALLLSPECRLARAYLDTVPVTPYLCLSDGVIINGCHFRLGATGTNPHVPATTCFCGHQIHGSDIDHAMSCKCFSSSNSCRHHWLLGRPGFRAASVAWSGHSLPWLSVIM
jgi:hypothetical protein